MKTVLKGLIIGALAGAVIGIVLKSLNGGSPQLKQVGRRVKEQAPVAADWLSSTADRGAHLLAEAHVPERVHDAAVKIGESDAADQAKEVAAHAAEQAKVLASHAKDSAGDVLAKGQAAVADARH